jgi:hypothetical protein
MPMGWRSTLFRAYFKVASGSVIPRQPQRVVAVDVDVAGVITVGHGHADDQGY